MSNSITVEGRVGRDAETKFLPSGTSVTTFSVACNTGFGEKKVTTWYRCTLWGKQGEAVAPFIKKGGQLIVMGEHSASQWTTSEGVVKTTEDINADRVAFGAKSPDAPAQAPAPVAPAPVAPAPLNPQQVLAQTQGVDDDDIPF